MGEKVLLAQQKTLQETGNILDDIQEALGDPSDTQEQDTLFGAIALKNGVGSIIKSIQRGVVTATSTSNIEITINAVDTSKCMVLLHSSVSGVSYAPAGGFYQNEIDNYYTYSQLSQVISLSEEKLIISPNIARFIRLSGGSFSPVYYRGNTSWQIVEFY